MPELIHSFGHTFFRIEFQRIVLYYTFLIYFRRKEDIAINDDAINHIRSSYVCVFHESLPKFLLYLSLSLSIYITLLSLTKPIHLLKCRISVYKKTEC